MGIPDRLEQLQEEDIQPIVARALHEAHPLYPVPRFMEPADCERVVRQLMR